MKGEGVGREIDAAEKAVRKARLSNVEVVTLGAEFGTEETRVFSGYSGLIVFVDDIGHRRRTRRTTRIPLSEVSRETS